MNTKLIKEEKNSEEFYIDSYLSNIKADKVKRKKHLSEEELFHELCRSVQSHFEDQWKLSEGQESKILERQTKAIIGIPDHVNYFKDLIRKYLEDNAKTDLPYPKWYKNLTDGIFHEVWGLAGISAWIDIPESSSAKIIGERIYYLIDGKMLLQEQKISRQRLGALKKALLLLIPEIPQSSPNIEILMHSGERVTIYGGSLTKPGQDIMVFRKYVVFNYTLEEQARRGTIPKESVGMLKSLAKVGFNILFCGAVRTAKTTMLTTFQLLEDPCLEGVLIESNAEIPMHELMPRSPIMQLVWVYMSLRGKGLP